MRKFFFAAVICCLFFSCNKKKPETGMRVVTDFLGREVEIVGDVRSVCITFNIEEYAAVAGEGAVGKIAGWSHSYWKGRRDDAYETWIERFPDLAGVADIGYSVNSTLNIEKIVSLKPDVVLASASVDYPSFSDKLELLSDAGIPVVFFDYHIDTKESYRRSNMIIGSVMNQMARAKELSDYYDEKVEVVENALESVEDLKRPRVYMEFSKGAGEYGNSWSDKMWGRIIENCGGTNIAKGAGKGNSVMLSKEKIVSSDPEVVILSASAVCANTGAVTLGFGSRGIDVQKSLCGYLDRREWMFLSAVKNRRLYAVYHDLSRHIFDFAGVEFVAKAIHPEIFEDMDPMRDLQDFFDRFMPVKANGTFFAEL